jgi:E3 ubiquitin-protein ligase MARCH6
MLFYCERRKLIRSIVCRHPLSELPIDLLFLHIVLPTIIESIKPRELISPFCHAWWEHAAHEFRLTSFLFGDRVVEEEVGSRFTWRRLPLIRDLAWVRRDEVELPDDGGFARVPASDSVVFPENLKQMLISTNEAGAPLDDRGAELIQAQDEAARKAHRDPAEDYQIVYLPPSFTRRVMAFMLYLWATGSAITVVALGTPILLGRRILDQIPGMPVHDGYSFLVGSMAAWAAAVIFGFLSRRYTEIRERRATNRASIAKAPHWEWAKLTADLYLGGALRTFIWAFNHIITWTMLGFVIPLLMATVLQLYILLPIRVGIYPRSEGLVTTLHIWEDWALGCVLAAIMVRIGRMQPMGPLLRAWDTVRDFVALIFCCHDN